MRTLSTSIVGLWGADRDITSLCIGAFTRSESVALGRIESLACSAKCRVEAGLSWSIAGSISNHFTVQESDSGSLFLMAKAMC